MRGIWIRSVRTFQDRAFTRVVNDSSSNVDSELIFIYYIVLYEVKL